MASKDGAGLFVIILIVILLGAGVYLIFFSKPDTAVMDNYQYSNGESIFNVTKVSDTETVTLLFVGKEAKPYYLNLRNDPLSVENITVDGTINTRLYNDDYVIFTINPDANLSSKVTIAAFEISKILSSEDFYNKTIVYARTMENKNDLPIASCYDGTDKATVVFFSLGSETKVYTDEYCIVVVGQTEDDIIRASDKLVYNLLGIMP
jgi:hypothetical protein